MNSPEKRGLRECFSCALQFVRTLQELPDVEVTIITTNNSFFLDVSRLFLKLRSSY